MGKEVNQDMLSVKVGIEESIGKIQTVQRELSRARSVNAKAIKNVKLADDAQKNLGNARRLLENSLDLLTYAVGGKW